MYVLEHLESRNQLIFRGAGRRPNRYVHTNDLPVDGLKAGRIAEIRAYYQYDESRDCELTGFPYRQRGYLSKDAQQPVKRGRANTPAPFA